MGYFSRRKECGAQDAIETLPATAGILRGQGATQLFCGTTYRPGYCLADQTIAPLFALQKEGLLGQGATEYSSRTAGTLRAQGATEYLVLLAVVLVIALVAIALLGFFPGMSKDAKTAQTQMYWQTATPIAIVEMSAKARSDLSALKWNEGYLKVKNTGGYPIRITGILGNGYNITQVSNTPTVDNVSDYYYLYPGEEKVFGSSNVFPGAPSRRSFVFTVSATSGVSYALRGLTSYCLVDATPGTGTLIMKNFGFEYVAYYDGGATATKQQIGAKDLEIPCGAQWP